MTAPTADETLAYVTASQAKAWTVPDVPADTPLLPIAKVGIIGAGTMGGGIAMNFATAGIEVRIVEQQQAALDRGLGVIRRNYENSANKGRFPLEEVELRMGRISGSLSLDDLADCDLIIEAVFENMEVKQDIFRRLDALAKPGAILATNTSALDVNAIAAVTARPQDVIGLHFFSPANVMKLLEIVRGEKTSKPVIATAMALAKRIGKIAVLVGVCPGFVGNRMLYRRQNQAAALLLEGAMPWDVDRVLNAFGFKMGPFAMSDLAGLDLGWNAETSKGETLRDVLCEMDRRGQKNGRGYYDYAADRTASPSPVVEQAIKDFAARKGAVTRQLSEEEILQRCLFPLINEGVKILEEGIAARPSDIDVVWLNGYGWPAHTGGPMFYADSLGLAALVARMDDYAERFGAAFEPAALLRSLAAQGRRLQDLRDGEAVGNAEA
jgi:3-hydroxyacyl-CoA dehydrogenase